jgi:hypothetical protein
VPANRSGQQTRASHLDKSLARHYGDFVFFDIERKSNFDMYFWILMRRTRVRQDIPKISKKIITGLRAAPRRCVMTWQEKRQRMDHVPPSAI